eukprot:1557345-Pleurochrysis_carterae.AAC.2
MCVGVGSKEEKLGCGELMKVAWLARPGWSNTPSNKAAFFWKAITPNFRAARTGFRVRRRQITSTEPLAAFLPVPLELTTQSANYDPSLPLLHSHQQQKNLPITKQCISALRAFCALRWPELIRTAEQAMAVPLGALPASAASVALTEHCQGAADSNLRASAADSYAADGDCTAGAVDGAVSSDAVDSADKADVVEAGV